MTEICTINQLMCVLVFVVFVFVFYRIPAAIIWVLSEYDSPQPCSDLEPPPLRAMSSIEETSSQNLTCHPVVLTLAQFVLQLAGITGTVLEGQWGPISLRF